MSTNQKYLYWDVGEKEPFVRPSQKALYKILNALILLNGKLHDSHSLEIKNNKWLYDARSSCVLMRISLPNGLENEFQKITGYNLSEPPKINLN